MWLGAGHAAACRRLSRIWVSFRIVLSSSSALPTSVFRSIRGRPSGANIRAISSSENPAALPRGDQRQPFKHAGTEHAAQTAPADRSDQSFLLVKAQRRGGNARSPRHFRYVHTLSLLTSSRLELASYASRLSKGKGKDPIMDATRQTPVTPTTKNGPLPGLLRPPLVFLVAILLGIGLDQVWPLPFMPSRLRILGPLVVLCAVLLFLLSLREFRASGTSVRGSERTTAIVRSGPYRFSRNPIYLSFVLLVLGLSAWLSDLWLLATLVPAIGFIAAVVIPREERFLERNFPDQYPSYKAAVRRWL
jgi:protein-S-isoprenylcysteine O-methyltransferase Ste14